MGESMLVDEVHWWTDPVRALFGLLDQGVYNLIQWVLYGVFDLSKISTNTDVFNNIYQRIYIVLGIFMAFKLSFSFFQYIINPDQVNGKSDNGVSKIFFRVILMLGALILLPSLLFGSGSEDGLLSRAQNAFLPMLPRIIFGSDGVNGTNFSGDITKTVEDASKEITVTTLSGFFRPSEDLDSKCGPGSFKNTPQIKSLEDFSSNINKKCAIVYYRYSYTWGISTIVGVLVLALFLGITLDIAKRIFKLLVLEIIAPIPIMSLIDPKGSKDGAFGHWSKSLINTFLDIFFKMGLLYLIIVLIHMIVEANASGGLFKDFPQEQGFRGVYLTIFLILGLIFFAKEAPKFIKDAMGIKDSGGGLFEDVKAVGKAAGLVGGAAVGTAGIIGSGIASGRASYMSDEENGKGHGFINRAKNIGAGLLGAGSGAFAAGKALTGKNAGIGSVMKAQTERNARVLGAGASGSTWLGRRGSEISNILYGETEAGRLGRRVSGLDGEKSLIKSITDRASGEMVKSNKTHGVFGELGGDFNYKNVKAAYDAAASSGATSFDVEDYSGVVHTISMQDANKNIGGLQASNEADYLARANVDGSGITDAKLGSLQENARLGGVKVDLTSRKDLKDRLDAIDIESVSYKRRQSKAQANDRYSAKK